jgi:hypothetical protein
MWFKQRRDFGVLLEVLCLFEGRCAEYDCADRPAPQTHLNPAPDR